MNRGLQIAALVVAVGGAGAYFLNRGRVDTSDADAKLKAWGEKDVGMPIKNVDCPKAKLEAGNKFDCAVEFVAGNKASITVDVKDDKGNVIYYWTKAITSGDKIAGLIADGIKQQTNKVVKVDCGKGILDLEPDGLKCTGSADGQTATIQVTYDKATHQVKWQPVQ